MFVTVEVVESDFVQGYSVGIVEGLDIPYKLNQFHPIGTIVGMPITEAIEERTWRMYRDILEQGGSRKMEISFDELLPADFNRINAERNQLIKEGKLEADSNDFFHLLSEESQRILKGYAPSRPQITGVGDEFPVDGLPPENTTESSGGTGGATKEQVESVRIAFTRESHRHGGADRTSDIFRDQREAEAHKGRSKADEVREAFISR
jgi:hypothetical protein